jgi:hypothetical protein
MTNPPNVMPEELQRAHYIMQIVKLEKLNAELLAALKVWRSQSAQSSSAYHSNILDQTDAAIAKAEERE